MKLKAVHCYQYIRIGNTNYNFITENPSVGLTGVEIDYVKDMNAVRIKTSKDDILVFTTNIAYAVPFTEENKTKVLPNRGALKDTNPGDKTK